MTTLTQVAAQSDYREAVLITPITDFQHELDIVLLRDFGGFTRTPAMGGWRDPSGVDHTENVCVYTIAMLDMPLCRARLRGIARYYRVKAKQQSVYVRWPNGRVEFIEA